MKVVLLVVLLVLATWADSAQAQKALRLCGREFFRAVVYTCGGSRWRRGQTEDPINDYEIEPDVESEMDRARREAYEALPSTCCKVGCRKSDLVLMC
uniref:Insulin-like 5b n=1 Tax=Cyprinus carpio TaxID=7962 RepID=A0A8C2DTC7_CYPCA